MVWYLISVFSAPLTIGITPSPTIVVCNPAVEFCLCATEGARRIRHFGRGILGSHNQRSALAGRRMGWCPLFARRRCYWGSLRPYRTTRVHQGRNSPVQL